MRTPPLSPSSAPCVSLQIPIALNIMTAVPWAGEGFFDMDVCAKENALYQFPDIIIKMATTNLTGPSAVTDDDDWDDDDDNLDDDDADDDDWLANTWTPPDVNTFDVILKPKQYLFEHEGCYFMGIMPSFGFSILGNIGMKGRSLVFDAENERVGFARGTCPGSWPYTPTAWQVQQAKDRKKIPAWQPAPWTSSPYDPSDKSNAGRI